MLPEHCICLRAGKYFLKIKELLPLPTHKIKLSTTYEHDRFQLGGDVPSILNVLCNNTNSENSNNQIQSIERALSGTSLIVENGGELGENNLF